MNEPTTDSLFARVFDAVADWMQSDPQLRRFVSEGRQWRLWDGSPRDLEEPTDAEMPCIRLTPMGDVMAWDTMSGHTGGPSHSMRMKVRIETWTKGTNVRKSMELWEAIMEALFPVQDPVRSALLAEAMREVHVNRRELNKAAFGDKVGEGFVYGDGLYSLSFSLVTPAT